MPISKQMIRTFIMDLNASPTVLSETQSVAYIYREHSFLWRALDNHKRLELSVVSEKYNFLDGVWEAWFLGQEWLGGLSTLASGKASSRRGRGSRPLWHVQQFILSESSKLACGEPVGFWIFTTIIKILFKIE